MHFTVLDAVAVLSAALLCVGIAKHSRKRRERRVYPPGPKGLPLIGNMLNMPKSMDWICFQEWGKTYGDIIFIDNPGSPMLVINSYEIAVDLLEKRGAIYSSRPRMTMVTELEGWGFMITWAQYGERLLKGRQTLHRFLQPSVVRNYDAMLQRETHTLLFNLMQDPDNFLKHIRHSAGAVIMMFSYGHEVQQKDDPFVELAERGLSALGDFGSFFLVDIFPILKNIPRWFPGAGFRRKADGVRQIADAMREEPYQMTKAALAAGIATPSMISKLIEWNTDESGKIRNEDTISSYAANIYIAGADTTVSVISTFVLAMVLYPDVQKRAQAELEHVIGSDCLPTFEDRKRLPYIEAIFQECLRWQIITPTGLPHCTSTDDYYKGFFIPKGTTVVANLWNMLRDPKRYSRPEAFIPERFLPEPGKEIPTLASKIGFGFGRRQCIGKHFAELSVFIAISSFLAAFNIEKAIGEDGQRITPAGDYIEAFLRYPKPFKCKITPRSSKIATLIQEAR